MHNFVVHSNESVCRKGGCLGLERILCAGKHTVRTYKYRNIKMKRLGVIYLNTSMVSTNGIPIWEKIIHRKNS